MPGIILNPIANYGVGQGQQPEPPYIPSYDSVYIAAPDMYYYSGSDLYTAAARTGGIVKLPFVDSGSLDVGGWTFSVNSAGTNNIPKFTRFGAPMREYILMDWKIRSGSVPQDYNSLQLVNKETSSIRYESTFTSTGGEVLGMTPAPNESYILAYGEEYLQTATNTTCDSGIAKLPYSTITTFATESIFNNNVGTGPINHTSGGAAGRITDIHITENGEKLGVAHNGLGWNGTTVSNNFFTVLNANGTLDSNFTASLNFLDNNDVFNINGSVTSVYYFDNPADGKKRWILGGSFKKVNGSSYAHIIALDETGSIDTTFSLGTGFNSTVQDIFKVDDDFMAVVGDFTVWNGTNAHHVAIIRYDGALLNGGNFDNGVRIWSGVYHNNYLYLRGDFTTFTTSGGTANANGIYSVKTDFSTINPAFDYGNGLQDVFLTGSSQDSTIFLG